MLLEQGTSSPTSASQFVTRGAMLDHAAVGLDSKKRAAADGLYAARLRDGNLKDQHRLDLVVAVAESGRAVAPDALADITTREIVIEMVLVSQNMKSEYTELVAPRMSPEQSAHFLAFVRTQHSIFVSPIHLSTLINRLPRDRAEEYCRLEAERLIREWKDSYTTAEDAEILAVLAKRLPPDRRAIVLQEAATAIRAKQPRPDNTIHFTDWLRAYEKVSGRYPPDVAETSYQEAADALLKALQRTEQHRRSQCLKDLVYLSTLKPNSGMRGCCGKAADILLSEIEKDLEKRLLHTDGGILYRGSKEDDERILRIQDLTAAAGGCAAEKENEIYERMADVLLKPVVSWGLTGSNVDLVAPLLLRLPRDRAATRCAPAIERLLHQVRDQPSAIFAAAPARGFAILSVYLPDTKAVPACETAAEAILEKLERSGRSLSIERAAVAVGLAALSARLPADRRIRLLAKAAEALPDLLENETFGPMFVDGMPNWPAVDLHSLEPLLSTERRVEAVATITTGLNVAERARLAAGPAGAGREATSPLPTPRLVPPQQLVELLKHPFCVDESRRVVLDALELTYACKFTDLWEFVAFAEKEHPELELLEPPLRPAK
jgi:hypothetical protein